jgi:hypothetical protein
MSTLVGLMYGSERCLHMLEEDARKFVGAACGAELGESWAHPEWESSHSAGG